MRRHFDVGAVDQGIVKACPDDGGLGIVRHEKVRNAADRLKGAYMSVDPVGQRLRPGRPGKT